MEVIGDYEIPDSWSAKGMNWNTPDPTNADYVMAIRQALLERCAALHTGADSRIYRISPWKTVSREVLKGVVGTISSLARSFVNVGWEEYEEDFSDFPRMWTYRDLVQERGCRLYEYAKYGSLVENGGEWLKQVRNAIDKLTVIRAGRVAGRSFTRYGSEHDPPFGESIGKAMQQAMDTLTEGRIDGSFPSSVHGWSGNTHWKCPRPDFEGDPKDNQDGYCGYASSLAYEITHAQTWLKDADCDIFAGIVLTPPTGPCGYSQQLDRSVFSVPKAGWRQGLTWTGRVRVRYRRKFNFTLGDADLIPQNSLVPQSEFDGKGIAIKRHSTKTGWIGSAYGFLDFGVVGGFKFQS